MNPLIAIDLWIINRLEQFCHFMQRTFGTTSATFARLCVPISIILATSQYQHGRLGLVGWTMNALTNLGLLLITLAPRAQVSSGTANSQKIEWQWVRIVWVVTSLVDIPGFMFYGDRWPFSEAMLLGFYFAACDDLPPGESRVRKLINSISASLHPAEGAA